MPGSVSGSPQLTVYTQDQMHVNSPTPVYSVTTPGPGHLSRDTHTPGAPATIHQEEQAHAYALPCAAPPGYPWTPLFYCQLEMWSQPEISLTTQQ